MNEEEVVIASDFKETVFSEPIVWSVLDSHCIKSRKELKFKRRLIAQVHKQRMLYDPFCKKFSNSQAKEEAWQKIAQRLRSEVYICRNTWIDLRYDYQCYVRRLRHFLQCEDKHSKRRPIMVLENEMLFLWRFINDKSCCRLPQKKIKNKQTVGSVVVDEDVVLLEDEPIVIEIEDEECNVQSDAKNRKHMYKLTDDIHNMVQLIQAYPELYDSEHRYFNDFKRKGIIWNAIANELGDKATKLMKLWIQIQTRYEWELNQALKKKRKPEENSELALLLEFLKPHILNNPNTVYKQSYFMKHHWQAPIEHFKNIYNLLSAMKKNPQSVYVTDEMVNKVVKSNLYLSIWMDIGKSRGASPGQCEMTWLILRYFYWELMSMRKQSYQLQDKWYFESIITELYAQAAIAKEETLKSVSKPLLSTNMMANNSATVASKMEIKEATDIPISTKQVKFPKIASAKSLAIPNLPTNVGKGLQIIPLGPAFANQLLPYGVNVSTVPPVVSQTAEVLQQSKPSVDPSQNLPQLVPLNPTTAVKNQLNHISPMAPLPKITNAVSLLNSNEIMIELISSANGNQLVVHGPPLAEKYSLSMTKTAAFIREVMAIPQLHNKKHNQPSHVNIYWQYLSKKFQLPSHVCKACWNFLSENFQHFPQISSMDDLMKPFRCGITVWKETHDLFKKFNSNAVEMGWVKLINKLPEIMQEISKYPVLYKDLTREDKNVVVVSEDETATAWRNIRLKFPYITGLKLLEIWKAFKTVFWRYMIDLESGIDNKWPLIWWRVLAKLKFLMEQRYHNMEPFYYIVRNKIIEEIERCNLIEAKVKQLDPNKRVTKKHKSTNSSKSTTINPCDEDIPATQLVAAQDHMSIATVSDSVVVSSKTPELRRYNASELNTYSLLTTIQRHSAIYRNCESWEKVNAWTMVAKEMNATITACRLVFQRALKSYRLYVARDPSNRCRIASRYFMPLAEMYRSVKHNGQKLNIKTPSELNQSVSRSTEEGASVPERFTFDINVENSEPSLVLQNWAYGLDELTSSERYIAEGKLRTIFNKYRLSAPS